MGPPTDPDSGMAKDEGTKVGSNDGRKHMCLKHELALLAVCKSHVSAPLAG